MVRPDQAVRAHPRSRGENLRSCRPGSKRPGSSPLTRGKRLSSSTLSLLTGLIPAHAGKTRASCWHAYRSRAHPRSRGENSDRFLGPLNGFGSSPLTRGKQPPAEVLQCRVRLIPAHAGKTRGPRSASSSGTAHPRSRGENSRASDGMSKVDGSSPLTRGKLGGRGLLRHQVRLIPAHAGKTKSSAHQQHQQPAHPRSRGENRFTDPLHGDHLGSSPLTRGKRDPATKRRRLRRLIPAHAGKTSSHAPCTADTRAHPRSRGENGKSACHLNPPSGSSPLTRGKRDGAAPGLVGWRLIPAHAGKTGWWGLPGLVSWAHPRSRGENVPVGNGGWHCPGSSPLTRGKLLPDQERLRLGRLIPAHAGKTDPEYRRSPDHRAHPRSRGENSWKR